MKTLIILINILLIINCVKTESDSIKTEIKSIDEKWVKTFDQFFSSFKGLADNYWPTVEKSLKEVNISSECSLSIKTIFTKTREEWVISSKTKKQTNFSNNY